MATKKQKRAAGLAKHQDFVNSERERNEKALARSKAARERRAKEAKEEELMKERSKKASGAAAAIAANRPVDPDTLEIMTRHDVSFLDEPIDTGSFEGEPFDLTRVPECSE